MDSEDKRTAQDLREAFARIANTENREELSSPKVKYNSKQQYIKINQVLNNAEIRGNWEYDLKKFVDSCDRETQSKLVCGNYIDIRTLKRNMNNSDHVLMLQEDWKFIATLLAFDSLKEKDILSLEECLEIATRRRCKKSPYNLNGEDAKRLLNHEPGSKEKLQVIEKPQRQKRKKGVIAQSKTVEALSRAVEENTKLKVRGRNMKTTTPANVRRKKLNYNRIWTNHIENTDYVMTGEVDIDEKLGFYRFEKTPTDLLRNRMDDLLIVTKEEAKRQIKERRDKETNVKKSVTEEELVEEMRKKKNTMARSTAWKKCHLCLHFAEVDTVILGSSSRAHYRGYHENQNTAHFEPLAFSVVQILEKD